MVLTNANRFSTVLSAAEAAAVASRLEAHTGVADNIESIYALSPLQEGMLFHALGSGDHTMYLVQQRLDITGRLDAPVFERAWSLVVARHPALRTVFAWEHDGPPVQVVCRRAEIDFSFHDLTAHSDAEPIIASHFARDRDAPFALDRPPLMRVALFRLAPELHSMMWTQHHLIEDGWSAATVLSEVFAAYESLIAGSDPALPAVRPFSDYIDWLERRDLTATRRFWERHLAGFSEPTRMAPPRPGAVAAPRRTHLSLNADLTRELDEYARTHGLTPNTVLTGALGIVLGRHLGTRDVAIGIVGSGRPADLESVEQMVGMFINTLVLRIEIDDAATVPDWLGDVQRRQAEVLEHGHTAMTQVQSWSGLGPGTTLTDTLFAYWNFGGDGASPSGDLSYRTVDAFGRTSFPFSITVESADPMQVAVDFDSAAVEPEVVDRFLEHLASALTSVVSADPARVGEVEVLTQWERTRLASFNTTTWEVPYPSVVSAFRAQVRATPDSVAVRDGDTEMTYAELDARSQRLAEHLIQVTGFAASRVALLLPRSAEMLVAVLASLKAGAAYVPIDRHLPAERVDFLLRDSAADVIVSTEGLMPLLGEGAPSVVTLPVEDTGAESLDFDIPVGANDHAYVMYTSGSTGLPKGVLVTHGNLANYVSWAHAAYGDGKTVSFPLYTSPGFDLTVTSMFVPLVSGGEVVVYSDDDARDLAILDVFRDDSVDVVKLTPSHLAVVDDPLLKTSRIRTLILGGEDLRVDLARRVHDASGSAIRVFNEYGPTEATVGCMIHRYDPSADGAGSVPIGRPAGNARIYLLDQWGAPAPDGAVGELYVAGAGVASGYLNRSGLTSERFVPDLLHPGATMYRTGDRASWRGDILEYVGRTDDQVKVRGHRIEPGEIEAALVSHPSVANAAVALREAGDGDARLVAYYVAAPAGTTNVTELRSHLRERLPEYMVVQHLVQVDELPLTPNGKLDRAALPNTIGQTTSSQAFVAPTTPAERLVADLTGELLGIDQVGMSDNFFELGGHSILAMQLITKLHQATNHRLSPRVVLLNTLGQAAAELPGTDVQPHLSATTSSGGEDAGATTAFYFGPATSPLFGIHYAPPRTVAVRGAVLLCPPLGWEYMRSHWAMRKIARLAMAHGFHVLRFDYFATGDSSGDRGMGSVTRWVDDVSAAAGELAALAGCDGVAVVGARLGATLAAAACGGGLAAERLVMWDPVVRGADHLETLERLHAELVAARGGRPVDPAVQGDELIGFPYPVSLRHELDRLDLTELRPTVPSTILATESQPAYSELLRALAPMAELEAVPDTTDWADLASTQSSLLPAHVPNRVVAALGEPVSSEPPV